jgi:hypothetical protein
VSGQTKIFPLEALAVRLRDLGAREVLVKRLAPNDNSKNQIYLASDVSALGKIPTSDVEHAQGTSKKPGARKRGPIFRASVPFFWLTQDGGIEPAKKTKLILYPQYSEVRLSGFLSGCSAAPSDLFDIGKSGRAPGRVLILAPLDNGSVVAVAFGSNSDEASILGSTDGEPYGVMHRFELNKEDTHISSERLLLLKLRQIHLSGWLVPVYLESDGTFSPCTGSNCGGVTLESHLGIRANGKSEPDFKGWEVKQHGVHSLLRPRASRITLMTPEPSGGVYFEDGAEAFIRTWGYDDQKGRQDRINFGGVYRSGAAPHGRTGLKLVLDGYDDLSGAFEGGGQVALVDADGKVAASWSFAKLMDHWRRKHAKAAFIPSEIQRTPDTRYRYGKDVMLAEGAKFRLLLKAFAEGAVYYDPGMKIEDANGPKSAVKRRSQFRVDSRTLSALYERIRLVDVTKDE